MRINNLFSNQNYNPNFKGINLVQVSKKAFANPENIKECSRLFEKTLAKATGDKLTGKFGAFIGLFVSPKFCKSAFNSENPSYYFSKRFMEHNGIEYSLNWLRSNTGLPIKDAIDADYHSYHVFTGEHIGKYTEAFKNSAVQLVSNIYEGVKKYPNSTQMATLYGQVKTGVDADIEFEKFIGDTPVKKIVIESLDELKDKVKEFN